MSRVFVVGVDGGASKTDVALADVPSEDHREARLGPGNVGRRPVPELVDEIVAAVRRLGGDPADVRAVAAGLAGVDRPGDGRGAESALRVAFPGASVLVVNDTLLALAGALGRGGHGLALVAGTGTNCIARTADGREERIGGEGYRSGDFGSGRDIAREAAYLAARGRDGRGAPTRLSARLEGVTDDAAIPPIVFRAAADGDRVARELLIRAGGELGWTAAVLARRAFPEEAWRRAIPLILAGSLVQRPEPPNPLVEALVARARAADPRLEPRVLEGPAVRGAVRLARDLLESSEA